MSRYTHVNKDETIFKTKDGKYINHRGCDITNLVYKLSTPQKYTKLESQPKFYLVSFEWCDDLQEEYSTSINGPYHSKEEAQEKECSNQYILLATDKGIQSFKNEKGLKDYEFEEVKTLESNSNLQMEEQLMFQHLNRKCNCGSGDIWSECNGINGDSSYCG